MMLSASSPWKSTFMIYFYYYLSGKLFNSASCGWNYCGMWGGGAPNFSVHQLLLLRSNKMRLDCVIQITIIYNDKCL